MPRQVLRIPVSKEQNDYLKNLELDNLAGYIRKLIRDAHPNFPPDKPVGVRDDYSKMSLLFDILSLINPHLPMGVETMQNIVTDWLIDNNINSITNEALVMLHTQGIDKFLGWFGMPPMYMDENRTIISILRIKSADDD